MLGSFSPLSLISALHSPIVNMILDMKVMYEIVVILVEYSYYP